LGIRQRKIRKPQPKKPAGDKSVADIVRELKESTAADSNYREQSLKLLKRAEPVPSFIRPLCRQPKRKTDISRLEHQSATQILRRDLILRGNPIKLDYVKNKNLTPNTT
jgi:hypothetical protein